MTVLALEEVDRAVALARSIDVDRGVHLVRIVLGLFKDNLGDGRSLLGASGVSQDESLSHNWDARSIEGAGNARTVRRFVFDHRESHRRHVMCCSPMGVGSDPRTGGAMRLVVVAPGGRAGGSDF